MNKTKSNNKSAPPPLRAETIADNDADTSDDDYIDPEMDKYFAKKGGESKIKKAVNGKSGLWNEEDGNEEEDDLSEYEEESVEENSSDEGEDDEKEENENENENGINENEEEDNDGTDGGRKKLTLSLIKKWSNDLGVIGKIIVFCNFQIFLI